MIALRDEYGDPFSHPRGPHRERRIESAEGPQQQFELTRTSARGVDRKAWIWPGRRREFLEGDEERRIQAWRLDHSPA